jgi:large subunit ribosomal protein L28
VARKCDICKKGVSFGLSRTYRGLAKSRGGVGIKCTGKERRKFAPNLQRVRVWVDGGVKRIKACTSCIRSGNVRKPIKRQIPEDVRQRMKERKA